MNKGDMPVYPRAKAFHEAESEYKYDGEAERFVMSCQFDGTGLTKREYFAGLAMQGLVTATQEDGQWAHDADSAAQTAVEYAEALLAELDK